MAAGLSKTKWNGNHHPTNALGSNLDVTLTYEGKKEEKDILATEPAKVRSLWGKESSNRLYYGDNLSILASLLPDYKGKFRLIYIDPPYATRSVFQSRSQNDAYADLLAGAHYIRPLAKVISRGRVHSCIARRSS